MVFRCVEGQRHFLLSRRLRYRGESNVVGFERALDRPSEERFVILLSRRTDPPQASVGALPILP